MRIFYEYRLHRISSENNGSGSPTGNPSIPSTPVTIPTTPVASDYSKKENQESHSYSEVFGTERSVESKSELDNVFFVSKPAITPSAKKEVMSVDEMIAQRRAQLMQK